MLRILILFLSVSCVWCQSCVKVDFEEGFDFDNERAVCSNFPVWNVGLYADTSIEPPHERSTTFVYPNPSMSCVTSFEFAIDTAGVLEVNVIVESTSVQDQLVLLVQGVTGANDVVIGQGTFASNNEIPLSTGGAVYTITIVWTVSGTYDSAYIALMGLAAEESIFLIDSFRYIPPTITNPNQCVLYEDDEESVENTTTEETEENTTTEETEENTTSETTDENTTTEETDENTTGEETEENTTTEETNENATTETTDENTTTETTDENTTGEESEENTTTEETEEITTTETTDENTTIEETDENTTGEETEENGTTETTDENTTTETTDENTTTENTDENTTTEETEENTTTEETEENTTTETTDEDTTTESTDEDTSSETTDENTEETEENLTESEEDTTVPPAELDVTTENMTEEITEGTEENVTEIETEPESLEELPVVANRSFWTPLTIGAVTVICFIIFCLICWFFYECGRRKSVKDMEPDFDFENMPTPILVPRVTKIYYEGSIPSKSIYPV